jgi:hypothetical protein
MVGLPDIAIFKLKHTIREGLEVEYTGLPVKSIAALFHRFPEIKKAAMRQSFSDFTMDSIVDLIPIIGAAVIAAAVGKPGDKKQEEIASSLPLGEQVEFVGKIWQATFPKGLDSFLAGLDAFGLSAGLTSARAANGTGRDGTLPMPSTVSSETAVSPQK